MFRKSKDNFEPGPGPPIVPPPSFQESLTPAAQPPVFKTKFACLTLNLRDRIRLINFPEPVVAAIQETITSCWTRGISRTRPYGQSYEIKVNGLPWGLNANGDDDARRLLLRIFERLFDLGWVHQAAIDVTGKSTSKDSLIFRKQDPAPPPCDWIIISFDRWDKLKVVGALPSDLISHLLDAFKSMIQRHEINADRLKIKFVGTPWMPTGEETVETRLMLLELLECLESCGFTVYAAVDMQSNTERQTDVVICQRQRVWTPGAPIWHR